jgi:caa(3)-type oxidase subunit IV
MTREPTVAEQSHSNYVKVWGVLVALLVVSVVGPLFEIKAVTLVTAFGVALLKAFLVARNFMHLHIERRYVSYLLVGMLAFMLLLFAGVAPDVMKHEGHQWKNEAAQRAVKEAAQAAKAH